MIARIGIKPKADIYDRAGVVIGTKRTSASLVATYAANKTIVDESAARAAVTEVTAE